MNIVVVGAGAMGLYCAGALAGVSCNTVYLLARGEAVSGFAAGEPITIDYGDRQVRRHDVAVIDSFDDVAVPVDAVIVAVKSWQVREVAGSLAPLIGPQTLVLTLQNGVDAPLEIAESLGAEHAVAATCVVIAQRTESLTVHCLGADAVIELGPVDRVDRPTRELTRLATTLQQAGMTVTVNVDMPRALWRKLMLVASYGGVGALTGRSTGETAADPESRGLVESAMHEVAAVARAQGIEITDGDVAACMAVYLGFEPATTSSMQRDLRAGRRSELFEQNGAVVAYAERLGVDVPVHHTVLSAMAPGERSARAG
ncbi:ketopantoate reductase family protein [Tsukamurella strandjordii]|uniref:2-dehydropantoate 2-reductase n=1 Tax=Tsukamurella strandjordii TaxID=147577 RepID=A0AA90S7B0_9ACTN|nr:ketopantoate reductase family protein [Tsukamurella strandjordii]MDP0396995.1 ketopantoate reductase family protein [Tsukamurella strandjordii]